MTAAMARGRSAMTGVRAGDDTQTAEKRNCDRE
jgi:hypothetical protein